MRAFLREFWPWIVVPLALLLGALFWLYSMSSGEGPSPFTYDILR